MISIGVVFGGPEKIYFDEVLTSLMKYTKNDRIEKQETEVNIVFHIPGSLIKPDYQGLRTGRFSKKQSTLMIQASVEEEFSQSKDFQDVSRYIYEVADEAIGLAKSFFDKKSIAYDLVSDRNVLDQWLKSLK